jgi:hypothetical protein
MYSIALLTKVLLLLFPSVKRKMYESKYASMFAGKADYVRIIGFALVVLPY